MVNSLKPLNICKFYRYSWADFAYCGLFLERNSHKKQGNTENRKVIEQSDSWWRCSRTTSPLVGGITIYLTRVDVAVLTPHTPPPNCPAKEAHFGRLYLPSCPFSYDPDHMTIGERRS